MHRFVLPILLCALAGCDSTSEPDLLRSYDFGPFDLGAGQEIENDCVQITLHNDEPIFVGSVELTTGVGFHHSNWLYVPEHIFAGPDGVFDCDERGYNEPVAAVYGGVLFAQSTQAPHEVQQFPPGVAVKLPARTKLIAQVHLLNATEAAITLRPNIKLALRPEAEVQTLLNGISFQNQALALPSLRPSRFTVECDLGPEHRRIFGRDPDFHIYYALAHYHSLGTGLTVEAMRADGTTTPIYSTASQVGDTLGGPIDPPFDMTGYTGLRFSCDFYNPRPEIVRWGFGDQEMCVFLAFADSTFNWGGGVNEPGPPHNEQIVGNAVHYTEPCAVFATDAER